MSKDLREDSVDEPDGRQLLKFLPEQKRKKFFFGLLSGLYILISALLLVVFLWWGHYLQHQFYVVEVDGREIGVVREKEHLQDFLQQIRAEKERDYGMEVVKEEKISFFRAFRPGAREDREGLREELQDLTFKVKAYALVVEGETLLVLEQKEALEEILEKLKKEYSSSDKVVEVNIKEEVQLEEIEVQPEEVKTAQEASRRLLGGEDRKEVHRIARGDTLSRISRQYDVSEEEIHSANPGVEERSLAVGDEVELVYEEPLLTVETFEEITREEKIDYPVEQRKSDDLFTRQRKIEQQGEPGLKKVTYQVKKENGHEVEKEKKGEEVIREPQQQVELVGTAIRPSKATGPFTWPVEGGGRITQHFGGAHRGVDIADSRGTPVLAACDGTVSSVREHAGTMGHVITIRHQLGTDTYYTVYMHNEVNLVSEGEEVSRGEMIARMGDTGRATGVHLHFEVRIGVDSNTASVDPLNYFAP